MTNKMTNQMTNVFRKKKVCQEVGHIPFVNVEKRRNYVILEGKRSDTSKSRFAFLAPQNDVFGWI